MRRVLDEGFIYEDKSRANMKMLQIPHHTLELPLRYGFPLISTKRVAWRTVLHELIWMLSGSTRIDYLQENGVKIWDKDAVNFSGNTYVGRIYGAQWRHWFDVKKVRQDAESPGLDQISKLLIDIRQDPFSRRHLVTAWNPAEMNDMALPPCHWSFEFIPEGLGAFMIKWHQRSCDVFLGIPFDIALYAFIGKLIEQETGLTFKTLVGDLSNVHFYWPHIELAKEQLLRAPIFCTPKLIFNRDITFDDITHDALYIEGYVSHPPIKAEMYAKVK